MRVQITRDAIHLGAERPTAEALKPKLPELERERFAEFCFAVVGSVIFEPAGDGAL